MILTLLYIDPGTGSALFAVIIGAAAAIVFSFHALLIKAKTLFTGGKIKLGAANKFVIYAEDKRYWILFKPIVEEFEKREIKLLYLTSSIDDPVFDNSFRYIKTEYLGEGNKAFSRLNFISADFVLATTPGLDVYQWKRSKMAKHYCHIFHTLELSAGYELYGMDYYDSILLSAEHDKIFIRKLEEARNLPEKHIVTVGCPYLDEYSKKISQILEEENKTFTVLVSPSWGKSALLLRFGEKLLDPLVKTAWRIIIRPHPQSLIVEKEMIEKLSKRYEANSNVEWDFKNENIYSLKKADVMISDFSGIILDYLFLFLKPVVYVSDKMDLRPYDTFEIYDNQDDLWIFKTLKKIGVELNPDFLDTLPDLIQKTAYDIDVKTAITQIKNEVWNYQGLAWKNVVDFMIKTAGEDHA